MGTGIVTVYKDKVKKKNEWLKISSDDVAGLPQIYPEYSFQFVDETYTQMIAHKIPDLPYYVKNDIYNDFKLDFEHLRNQNWQPYKKKNKHYLHHVVTALFFQQRL